MNEITWTKEVPKESGFYWAKWHMLSYDMPVEVDSDGSVWLIGAENDHASAGLVFGPRIDYLWENAG